MSDGPSDPGPERLARRPGRRWAVVGVVAVALAVTVGALIATGVIPLAPAGPAGSYRISEVVVDFTGTGGQALCPEAGGSTPTCGSAVLACDPASLCNETLRTGDNVPIGSGVSFSAILSNTFDCNYTFSIAQISSSGAFAVSGAQANGAALPVNVGFDGAGSACVTLANISVGFVVGHAGPSNQSLFLTIAVAQELR